MYFILETEDQLSRLERVGGECYIELVTTNDNFHPKLTGLVGVYIRPLKEPGDDIVKVRKEILGKGYIIPVCHNECASVTKERIVQILKKFSKIYILNKKNALYHLVLGANCVDLGLKYAMLHYEKLGVDREVGEKTCDWYYNRFGDRDNINQIIPISKLYERCEARFKKVQEVIKEEEPDGFNFYNEYVTKAYFMVEETGLRVDVHNFVDKFKPTNPDFSIEGETVYTSYNLYNTTSRPTNSFNSVNFLAIPKGKDFRKCFKPQQDHFVELDFDGYHVRLVADLVGFSQLSDKEKAHKQLARMKCGKDTEFTPEEYAQVKADNFKMIYGSPSESDSKLEFSQDVQKRIKEIWEIYEKTGKFSDSISGKTFVAKELKDMYPQKLFNYTIQCLETSRNTRVLCKVLKYLSREHYKTRVVLITYDSFLLDVAKGEERAVEHVKYTFKQVQNQEINLGLDLKGGMNVMLQVQIADVVKAIAGENATPEFNKALELAKTRSVGSQLDFITLFADAWKEVAGGQRLAQIFGTYEMRDRIKPESTDEQVRGVIRTEAESAVANSFNVLRNRIDRFGVTQPSIQRIGNTGRILVELPGVKEPERVRKLLQGTASLEFWTTYENQEIYPYIAEANTLLGRMGEDEEAEAAATASAVKDSTATAKDSTAANKLIAQEIKAKGSAATAAESADAVAYRKANPLFAILSPSQFTDNACIGFAAAADTALVNRYLHMPEVAAIFPAEFRAMWSVKPSEYVKGNNIYELIAIKASSRDGKAPLDGGVITDARVDYENRRGGEPGVSMSMNAEGANTWARLTKDNIGRQVAIVLDGTVYSYPTVQTEISGGSSSITGHFTVEEATDLTNVLKSGKLPAPATIVQEQVVGPSLGAESIHAGVVSFVIAFFLVLIYMIFFYQGAGVAADIALLANVVLLFGTLSAFGAVLTLPGIAGLVLTLGMAVDANVIIYERVKEELKAGKGMSKAISDGYKNAYSAIIDGQVTTLLTGIILYVFGSGSVKGFAAVLVIGIITSVFTSIFITRLLFERWLQKGKDISFDSPATREFLQHTKVDFIGKRKISYLASGIVCLICLVSCFTKGFTMGVDFTGGRTYVVRFDAPVTPEEVRAATFEEFNESAEVKQFGGASQMRITTKYKVDDLSQETDKEIESKLFNALNGFFATPITLEQFTSTLENPNGIISSDRVDASIASEMKSQAVLAVILALFVIFAYIAIRFKNWTWGLGGVSSLAHNSIIIIGFYSLFTGILPFTLDVDQQFIAAVLTIIGYSINDNVVIFDRIREYKALYPTRPLRQNVNEALNSTLSRTINTSLTTLLPMIAIAI